MWLTSLQLISLQLMNFIVLEKCLLIIDSHFSQDSDEVFQLARNHCLSFVYLPLHVTHRLQLLCIVLFEPLPKVYCLKLDKEQQAGNLNINQEDFLPLFKWI